jgi:hypothetical protein
MHQEEVILAITCPSKNEASPVAIRCNAAHHEKMRIVFEAGIHHE